MTELLTAAQMRAVEAAAIASGEVTGLELMERAGQGVVDAIVDWRPELGEGAHRAVVLCGPGNNGGDGFVVARLLHERGWQVEVFLFGDQAKLPPDAAANARRWQDLGKIRPPGGRAFDGKHQDGALYIDALFGTGLTRPLEDKLFDACRHLAGLKGGVHRFWAGLVAIDAPSGLCLDSGRPLEKGHLAQHAYVPTAGLTVTFQWPKRGHHLADGPAHCGRLAVVDIGIAKWLTTQGAVRLGVAGADLPAASIARLVAPDAPGTWPFRRAWLEKSALNPAHKYDHGHAMILSGGPGKGGAARLAARGALRIGAGLVTVGCPPAALQENAARLDAVMLAPLRDAEALAAEIADRKVGALCLGPGFGTGERLRAFVAAALAPGLPVVLDADALTEYRGDPETLFAMLHERCVLTPHDGEFGRLFPDLADRLKGPAAAGPAFSKVDAARAAAERCGAIVLIKGPDTVIANPGGAALVNAAHRDRGAPWLATAGSGDVLAGFVTGLLARRLNPLEAVEMAAWLHTECARRFGPGLIAEDLPEQLPAVFRDLGL